MKLKSYAEFVEKRAKIPLTNLDYSFIGLGGEAGECLEWYKKSSDSGYRDKPEGTDDDLLNELGDVLHYAQRICLAKGWTLKDAMKANIKKLEARDGRA